VWHSGGLIDEQINGCYGTLPWMDHQRRLLTHCCTLRAATSCILRNFLPALICQDEKVYIEKSYGKDWIP
jgi:N-acetylglucosamine-6-phosphate deacetylase